MNIENMRDYIVDALVCFDDEDINKHDRNNMISLIDWEDDTIDEITIQYKNNDEFYIKIFKTDIGK